MSSKIQTCIEQSSSQACVSQEVSDGEWENESVCRYQTQRLRRTSFKSYHHSSLQVFRTLRRQELDYERKYDEQIDRGRAGFPWRQCFDPKCERWECFYQDFPFQPVLQRHKKPWPFRRRVRVFVTAMVEHLYGKLAPRESQIKQVLVESFVKSPVVRGAYGQFSILCEEQDLRPTSEQVSVMLTADLNLVLYLTSTTRRKEPVEYTHVFFGGGPDAEYPEDWTLRHFILQFIATVESWRRYEMDRGANWDFGSDKAMARFLCSVLVNYVQMERRGYIWITEYSRQRLSESWESWLDNYHPFNHDGDGGDDSDKDIDTAEKEGLGFGESGCLVGYGCGHIPWESERMRLAHGWF